MVDCAQRFGVYLQLVLLHLLQCAAAVDPYALVLECANEVVQQLARREASALNLNALADLQRHLSLIEDEGHDLIGVMDEVEHSLPVKCEQRADFGVLVVATGVLLQYLLIKQVVYEDVAAFVGDEQVLAQN